VFWLYFVFFAQNLRPGLVGTLYPSWSLAIEEQFYLAWAPAARYLPAPAIAAILGAILAGEPWVRGHWALNPVNTLYHLDGLAVGALLALGLRTLRWPRATWARLGWAATGAGALGLAWAARGHGAWVNSFLALGFGGWVVMAIEGEGRATLWVRGLRLPAMRFLGRISYGLYLTQVIVFALLGGVDEWLDRAHAGAAGDLAIVAMRTAAAIAVAAGLWYGFERPVLKLKRFFPRHAEARAAAPAAVAVH
jgi:peptidoglycan/LPS O-acetylase OafA/YrhL